MVQPPDYYRLLTMQVPDERPRRGGLTPVRGTRTSEATRATSSTFASFRSRVRRIIERTTLGPARGDHVLGEGQWPALRGSYPIR